MFSFWNRLGMGRGVASSPPPVSFSAPQRMPLPSAFEALPMAFTPPPAPVPMRQSLAAEAPVLQRSPPSEALRAAQAKAWAQGVNGVILKLMSLADVMVLGERGIAPVLDSPDDDLLWDDYEVDAAGEYMPLDYQRVVLTSLLLMGEAFVWDQGNGRFTPLPPPPPDGIKRNRETGMVERYVWPVQPGIDPVANWPRSLPASQVIHLMVRWTPTQGRGISAYAVIMSLVDLRDKHIVAAVQREVLQAVYHMVLKSSSVMTAVGNETGTPDDDTDEAKAVATTKEEIDLYTPRIIELSPEDAVETLRGDAGAIDPHQIEAFLANAIGAAFGLSGLSITGDARDSNYSSSRLALEMDSRVWARYRGMLIRATRPVYSAWRGRVLLPGAPNAPEWGGAAAISLDPVKTAAAHRQYVEARVVSRKWVRTQLGVNSARMAREIAEEEERNERSSQQPADG